MPNITNLVSIYRHKSLKSWNPFLRDVVLFRPCGTKLCSLPLKKSFSLINKAEILKFCMRLPYINSNTKTQLWWPYLHITSFCQQFSWFRSYKLRSSEINECVCLFEDILWKHDIHLGPSELLSLWKKHSSEERGG